MKIADSITYKEELVAFSRERRVEAVFRRLAERLLFEQPDQPVEFLLGQLRDHWEISVTFLVAEEPTAFDRESLLALKTKDPRFDFFDCGGNDFAVSDLAAFVNSPGGAAQRCVIGFPRSAEHMQVILDHRLFFDKLIICGAPKRLGTARGLVGERYADVAVRVGPLELADYFRVG